MSNLGRRKFLLYGSAALGTSILLKACGGNQSQTPTASPSPAASPAPASGETIKVGILHSLSGTMAISETSVVDAEKLAIEEINAAGGVLGKQIEAVVEDGASDWPTFTEKATKLIDQDKVVTVFGCWTSASRQAVLPVFEAKNHMLWYPVQYEGQECSRNIFYTGAAPNQQIEPAVTWLLENKGKKFFLVGSDYVFPRTANTIIKEQLKAKGGETVGEDYLPLGITATLVGQFRTWAIVKLKIEEGEKDDKNIAAAAEIANPKRLYFIRKEIQSFSSKQLLATLPILLELEYRLKRGAEPTPTIFTWY